MTVAADETTVRQFIAIISAHAVELAKGNGKPGALQLSTLSPVDEKLIPTPLPARRRRRHRRRGGQRRQRGAERLHRGAHRARLPARQGARRDRRYGIRVRPGGRRRSRQGQGRRRHGRARAWRSRPRPGIFITGICSTEPVAADEAKRVGDLIRAYLRDRPGHRRRHPVLPGARHPIPVESQTGAWPSRCGADPHRRADGRRWELAELEAAFAGAVAATTSGSSCGPSTTTADADEASLPTN